MILVSDVITALDSRLDAQGSDYYNFTHTYKTAINESIRHIVSLIDRAVEQNKVTTEVLYSLQKAVVIQLSKYSRFTYDENVMWSIRSINPLPKTESISVVIPQPDDKKSVARTDLVHQYSNYWCKRLTKEEWELNSQNPFSPGNIITKCSTLEDGSADNVSFAYLNPYYYGITSEGSQLKEIEIRPYLPNRLVTVFCVEKPSDISDSNDSINLHSKLFGFLIEKCLQYISYEQGDNTNIFTLSQVEIKTIANILL